MKEIGVGGPRNIFDVLTSSQPFCQLFTKNDIGFYFYYEISKFVVSFQNIKNTASIDTNSSIKMGNGTCEKLKRKILEYWLWYIGWKSENGSKYLEVECKNPIVFLNCVCDSRKLYCEERILNVG